MNHPITPSLELVRQWNEEALSIPDPLGWSKYIATQAARWGADQELEACCAWLQDPDLNVDTYKLRAARRPKPPSLAEQALAVVENSAICDHIRPEHETTLRAALDRLKELEQSND